MKAKVGSFSCACTRISNLLTGFLHPNWIYLSKRALSGNLKWLNLNSEIRVLPHCITALVPSLLFQVDCRVFFLSFCALSFHFFKFFFFFNFCSQIDDWSPEKHKLCPRTRQRSSSTVAGNIRRCNVTLRHWKWKGSCFAQFHTDHLWRQQNDIWWVCQLVKHRTTAFIIITILIIAFLQRTSENFYLS